MSAKEYSDYQRTVINDYYKNIDTIQLTKLQELVTELFLAQNPSKREKLWERVHKTMTRLKINPALIRHIMEKKDVTILAKNLQDWLKQI